MQAEIPRHSTLPELRELGVYPRTPGRGQWSLLEALRLLRDEGLLEFRRGRGVTVAGSPEKSAVVEKAKQLLEFARFHGYRKEDLIDILGGLS